MVTITTPNVETGEKIKTTWGNSVVTDLTSLNNAIKTLLHLYTGASLGINFNVIAYPYGNLRDAIETNAQLSMPLSKVISVRINVSANTLNNITVVTLRKNGIDTDITANINAGVTGQIEITGEVLFADKDLLSVEFDTTSASSGTITMRNVLIIYSTQG